jgi:hypothetical protein
MTTASSNNSFVQDGLLYILPTATSDILGSAAVFDGHVFNLTGCTGANYTVCSAVSNASMAAVIPPVMSARLTTKNSTAIRFGRVEIRAKLPRGDWIWPSLRMLPVVEVYGGGIMSGEIDVSAVTSLSPVACADLRLQIMQSRGNGPSYSKQGTNYVRSSLHWGPTTWLDVVFKVCFTVVSAAPSLMLTYRHTAGGACVGRPTIKAFTRTPSSGRRAGCTRVSSPAFAPLLTRAQAHLRRHPPAPHARPALQHPLLPARRVPGRGVERDAGDRPRRPVARERDRCKRGAVRPAVLPLPRRRRRRDERLVPGLGRWQAVAGQLCR